MVIAALDSDEISRRLPGVPGWVLRDGRLHRSYLFADFVDAFGFMTRAALVAERLNHHPDWSNVWNRVEVVLHTHDANGLTALDFELACAMDRLAGAHVSRGG